MTLADKFGHYWQFTLGISELIREPVPTNWEERMRDQLENRETRWLATIRKGIFDRPDHPYTRMFEIGGCSYEELERSTLCNGLEATLEQLVAAGIFLTHDEFKGKQPIVRSGQTIAATTADFANPLARGGYEGRSSGSRSSGTRTRKTAAFRMYSVGYQRLREVEFDLAQRTHIAVRPILPSGLGITGSIRASRTGRPCEKWFAIAGGGSSSLHYRSLTSFLVAAARLQGVQAPFPTYLPPNDFSAPARLIAEKRQAGEKCYISSFVSPSVRVAAAARDLGLDISGTLFLVGGEALTRSKRELIESIGCETTAGYTASETGPVGNACRSMTGNCVHVFSDAIEVVTRKRAAPFSGIEVNSLMFTALLPMAPYLFINVEMDDEGVVEESTCDCVYSRFGFRKQIRDMASYGKLTGQGMTLVGTSAVEILDKVLPARFGGAPTDYQLVEQEGDGQTQLTLRVSPRVKAVPDDVKRTFLESLPQFYGGALAKRIWENSAGIHAVTAEPVATSSGKVLSLYLLGPEQRGEATGKGGKGA